ncbi:MAG TPA: rod shape-determining protein MreC [Allosphingosinicella sp.]|jgi:rod shape-determining protein MreC|uniref:rod shape-determining protein MreC n=1 Tax=Allosphingosinicella sp. TaxID=2823234 RepID=UPI002F286D8D
MAPPKSRRPGFSRKAQYGLFFGYVLAVGGVLVAVVLLLLSVTSSDGFGGTLRGLVLDITSPVAKGGRGAVRAASEGGSKVSDYFGAGRRNSELRDEIKRMRVQILQARATELENKRLKQLLGLREAISDEVALARIVGSTFDSSRRLATLSVGAAQGVRVGQPVRAPEGLIGRVVEVGRWASRILLVTDGASNVPVRLVRDGTPALATGRGDGTIEIKPLEVGKNPFRQGDLFVSSGVGGIFAPGIPVAIVIKVDRDDTIARPIANPARIDFAIVQSVFQPAANQPLNVAPPPPAAGTLPSGPAPQPAPVPEPAATQ